MRNALIEPRPGDWLRLNGNEDYFVVGRKRYRVQIRQYNIADPFWQSLSLFQKTFKNAVVMGLGE